MPEPGQPLLDADQAAFICGAVSICASSSRANGLPDLARATGVRVSEDRATVTVLFASTPGAAVLDDVRRNGRIAVVFTEPGSHRTIQLKGDDACIVSVESGDAALAVRYAEAFASCLVRLGYDKELGLTLLACDPEDLVAVRFSVAAGFSQTPGPNAGEPLRSVP